MKISAVIITHNEEDRLPDALLSCQGVVDEVVVVDDFSTDRTVEIAKDSGARVVQHGFEDFGSQKNFALQQAQYDWVLNLDADERIAESLKTEIIKLRQLDQIAESGFSIRRKTWYLGRWIRHSGWYPDRKLRLFRKDRANWVGRVHERLELSGICGLLPGEILHYTYRDVDDHVQRINRYSRMQGVDLAQKKSLPGILFNLCWNPPLTFVRFYLWKLGFLDGFAGLVIALVSSWGNALKYLKAWEIKRRKH